MFRDRRKGIRRIYEVAELIPNTAGSKVSMEVRTINRWNPAKDVMEKFQESHKLMEKLQTFTGMTEREIEKQLKEKQFILEWMMKNKIKTLNGVGKVVDEYYQNPEETLEIIRRKTSKATDLVPEQYLEI